MLDAPPDSKIVHSSLPVVSIRQCQSVVELFRLPPRVALDEYELFLNSTQDVKLVSQLVLGVAEKKRVLAENPLTAWILVDQPD